MGRLVWDDEVREDKVLEDCVWGCSVGYLCVCMCIEGCVLEDVVYVD